MFAYLADKKKTKINFTKSGEAANIILKNVATAQRKEQSNREIEYEATQHFKRKTEEKQENAKKNIGNAEQKNKKINL